LRFVFYYEVEDLWVYTLAGKEKGGGESEGRGRKRIKTEMKRWREGKKGG
jgi:hypothetical protein